MKNVRKYEVRCRTVDHLNGFGFQLIKSIAYIFEGVIIMSDSGLAIMQYVGTDFKSVH